MDLLDKCVVVDISCFSGAFFTHNTRVQIYYLFMHSIYSKMATCSTSYMSFPTQHCLTLGANTQIREVKVSGSRASTPTRW